MSSLTCMQVGQGLGVLPHELSTGLPTVWANNRVEVSAGRAGRRGRPYGSGGFTSCAHPRGTRTAVQPFRSSREAPGDASQACVARGREAARPCPGIAGSVIALRAKARLANWPALIGCAARSTCQIATPSTRHARSRAGCEAIAVARPSRQSLRLMSRRPRRRRRSGDCGLLRVHAAQPAWGSPCAGRPTALPPRSPRAGARGTGGGIFLAVGRETGAPLRLR